jgi:hypothetical protein
MERHENVEGHRFAPKPGEKTAEIDIKLARITHQEDVIFWCMIVRPKQPPIGANNPPQEAKGTPAASGLFDPVGDTVPEGGMTFIDFNIFSAETGNQNLIANIVGPVGSKKADSKRPF